MKISSINNQQNFRGNPTNFFSKNAPAIAGLASASVVAQKLVMSAAEAGLGPVMDIGIGKTISTLAGEKDGRFEESSKVQAVRSFSQTVGGTITGVIIRAIAIGLATFGVIKAASKVGEKTGGFLAKAINPNGDKSSYLIDREGSAWGRTIGGAVATIVMLFTNFLIDAPLINLINKKVSSLVFGDKPDQKDIKQTPKTPEPKVTVQNNEKEAK